ncbi:MAG: glycosyl hydrolase [Gammaproteobacteria bacterium]
MEELIGLLALWVVSGTTLFVWHYWGWLRKAWCEPVLRQLVVIFESDDWGPGGTDDVQALQRLTAILESYRDSTGRPAVMTLGVVLAVPDTRLQEVRRGEEYVCRSLDDDAFRLVRTMLSDGEQRGVFALQLHGMEHYWPAALMKAARAQPEVLQWLDNEDVPRTERLPSALQTRWADCATLPAAPIDEHIVRAAVDDEVTTFVWTDATEEAWAANAVQVIVTPGQQYTGRDSHGALEGGGERFWNGQAGPSGLSRVVRDTYFEPAYGHRKGDGLRILEERLRCGQPVLMETHRFNYLSELSEDVNTAFAELEGLLNDALDRFPQLVFRSTQELATALESRDEQLVERSVWRRVWPVLSRLNAVPGLRRWAILSGAVVPGICLVVIGWLTRRRVYPELENESANA